MIRPYYILPLQPPYPHWYDQKAQCEYHSKVQGHSIENCTAFKRIVQNLINTGVLKFDEPSISTNPLPKHGGRGVNVIEEDQMK